MFSATTDELRSMVYYKEISASLRGYLSGLLRLWLYIFSLVFFLSVNSLVDNYPPSIRIISSLAYAADKKPSKPSSGGKRVVKKKRAPVSSEVLTPEIAPTPIGSGKSFDDRSSIAKPVDAILVLDSSRSMKRNDPERLRDQGARLFLQFLEPGDRFAIIDFAEEASVLFPFTPVQNTTPKEISDLLESIENEGNFTDFLSPLELSLELFETDLRPGSEKVIILLSDGEMDPDPAVGGKSERTAILLDEVIPKLSKQNIRLHSLGFSRDADARILKLMSSKADGLSWYTRDVNTVHRIFSDLFLSIKKPQVLELTKDGFEIDSSTEEATFFVNRKNKEESVTVVDPLGKEFVNRDFPSDWKWFRGDLFDVVTIHSPTPGVWGIRIGNDTPSGFAKLISNLKLEHSWPGSMMSIGDVALLKARLTENGSVLSSPELAGLIFYSFKIVNMSTGKVYLQGRLNETGDGVAEGTISLNEEGDFKLFLSVTSPTFTRQAHIPFSVSRGLISLEHISANEFTGAGDSYRVVLHPNAIKLKGLVVGLLAKSENSSEEVKAMNITKSKISDTEYEVPLGKFAPGTYMVSAVVNGMGDDKKKVSAKSEELKIVISESDSKADESDYNVGLDGLENFEEKEPEKKSDWPYGVGAIIFCLIVSAGASRFFIKKSLLTSASTVKTREPYQMSSDLASRLEVIKERVSEEKRQANETELELFAVLPDLQKVLSEIIMTKPDEPGESVSVGGDSPDDETGVDKESDSLTSGSVEEAQEAKAE
ncbi:MAG TPA: vWA domain-containing protein [Oligoflexia bacterium]|nr:vWA domain-containing protein [Oligoflexia bacterium]HMP48543.1 vWA domain-containing protein [Oligoflexia bacterium]